MAPDTDSHQSIATLAPDGKTPPDKPPDPNKPETLNGSNELKEPWKSIGLFFTSLSNLVGHMGTIVLIELVYIVLLFTLVLTYLANDQTILGLRLPASLGPLPIAIPWFGALGAVMISLSAASDHVKDWDPAWRYWHLTRPLVGAALAVVSVLAFQAGVLAIGSSLPSTSSSPTTTPNLLYYVIAFAVGYREAIFRQLIKRIADVILTPGGDTTPPTIGTLTPATGPIAGGSPVAISGSGFKGVISVKFGPTPALAFTPDSASQITAQIPPAPQGIAGPVNVTITTSAGSVTGGQFTYV